MKKIISALLIVVAVVTACENQDWEFKNFDYTTVYFPYQAPGRTIELGTDYVFDNTLDNQHKCLIMATMGGAYKNNQNITITVAVDNSLCAKVKLSNASSTADTFHAVAMPSNYYTLPATMQIVIPSGKLIGGIEVQLTDAFFDDILSTKRNYVIPLVITSVTNADSVLRGKTDIAHADRRIATQWSAVPKDYVLYSIKFINPWHASYLRRGIDDVKGNSGNTALDTTEVYHKQYVEWDQGVSASTVSKSEVQLPLTTKNRGNKKDLAFALRLKFADDGKCTISKPDTASGYTITGNGAYVTNGDMWGGKNRDVLHLNYTVIFPATTHTFTDTLVIRDRGVKFEAYSLEVLK
jgi:hypothetical protein